MSSREIKFRGKRLDTGEWVYGYVYLAEFDAWIIQEQGFQAKPNDVNGPAEYDAEAMWVQVDPATVGQYTGLVDKNGKDVYEGDILAGFNTENGNPVRLTCEYHGANHSGLGGAFRFNGWLWSDLQQVQKSFTTLEVIGNIYSNPELLEAADE
jgi:uncharacterized phage protein (TIGR01671 family)